MPMRVSKIEVCLRQYDARGPGNWPRRVAEGIACRYPTSDGLFSVPRFALKLACRSYRVCFALARLLLSVLASHIYVLLPNLDKPRANQLSFQ